MELSPQIASTFVERFYHRYKAPHLLIESPLVSSRSDGVDFNFDSCFAVFIVQTQNYLGVAQALPIASRAEGMKE